MQSLIKEVEGLRALDRACHSAAGWVGRMTRPNAVKNTLSGTWLGHPVHPALTALPIGAWTMAFALDVTAGRAGTESARRLVGLGLLATLPAAATGASDWSETSGATQRAGFVHAVCNVTAAAVQAASWVARRRGRHRAGAVLGGAGLGITACAAYLGGHLSFVRGVGVNHTAFEHTVEEWTDVAALSGLQEGRPHRVTAGGVPVVLVQHEGFVSAISATCTHAAGPLDEGEVVDGECIRCPWHGSVFRLLDGTVRRGPATVAAPRWDVKVDDEGRVYVRAATSCTRRLGLHTLLR